MIMRTRFTLGELRAIVEQTRYSTEDVFTLGELRAIVEQTKDLPDEVSIYLQGNLATAEASFDVIELSWDEA